MGPDFYNRTIAENIYNKRESILPLKEDNIAKFASIRKELMGHFEVKVTEVPNMGYQDGDMQTSLDGSEYEEKSDTLQVVELRLADRLVGSFIIDGNEFHTIGGEGKHQRKFSTKVDGSGGLLSEAVENIDNPTYIDTRPLHNSLLR